MKFNYDRYSAWVKSSMAWLKNDPDSITFTRIQGLGIIDAELYDINKYDVKNGFTEYISVYDHVNIKSYLWILGVYELFRMIDQRLRENETLANEDATESIKFAKKQFERIRIPLAKLEKAQRHKGDYAVPKFGANDEQLAWQINDDEIIYYRDLSNLALETLNRLRASNIKKNGEENSSSS